MKPRMRAILIGLALAIAATLTQVMPSIGQDASPKKNAFDQCAVCHSTDGSNGTGPTLKGVFGRQSGTAAGFRYSRAMRNAGITWDEKSLDQYLSNPQEFIAGNVMPFSGVADPGEREAIIVFLRSLK
ncbi:MAG TPA: c-type cytochrome [Steroidobacteraceae bacterium]|jgi:cytochrome c